MKKTEEMTLAEIKEHRRQSEEIERMIGCQKAEISTMNESSPYVVGNKYFIRTVTFYYVGELIKEYAGELVFKDASWIPDTGRFSDALKTGSFNEVEPIPEYVILPKAGFIDVIPWAHEFPKSKK